MKGECRGRPGALPPAPAFPWALDAWLPAPPRPFLASSPASQFCSSIPDKPLSNMKILTLGKLSRNKEEVKATIEKLGGKLTGTVNKASLCISTKSELQCICKAEATLCLAIAMRIR